MEQKKPQQNNHFLIKNIHLLWVYKAFKNVPPVEKKINLLSNAIQPYC